MIEAASLSDLGTILLPVRKNTREEFRKIIKEMLNTGLKRDNYANWSFAINLVRNKDGKMCVTSDERRLNEETNKDCYPIPKIDDLFQKLACSRIFTT